MRVALAKSTSGHVIDGFAAHGKDNYALGGFVSDPAYSRVVKMDDRLGINVHDREVPRHIYDDVNGQHWIVREVDSTTTPGARAPRCLIFDSGAVARRLWSYPRDWGMLPPGALLKLMR